MIWLLVDSATVGGIERHIATLAQALNRSGEHAEIILLADHGANPWRDQLATANLNVQTLDGSLGGLVHAVKTQKPSLLHTHGYKANILGRLVAQWTRTPVVATFHAGERAPFPVNAYQTLDEWTSILGGRIAVSHAIQATMPYRSRVIENFLLTPPKPVATQLPRRIGFVGRLSLEKAPDRFCELAQRCGHIAEWHVWGDGPMRPELENAFAAHVTFHGLITDLTPVWPSLGLLVMPSRAEGLPMAGLEAFAAGVPIAACPVGGLPTLVEPGKTGWLFDGNDLADAERAITTWANLGEPEQRAMRLACWQLVADKFSDSTQLPELLEVYRSAGWR
jgi:glycosyltransferase involved in cell wall biosynthesis